MKLNNHGDYVLVICPNPSIDIYASVKKFEIGSSNRLSDEKRYPGGKGLHVAMALSELGIEVVLIGFWGSVTGRWIIDECRHYYPKIKCYGPELEGWSRSCYTFKSNAPFDDTEILGTGPEISANAYKEFTETVEAFLPKSKAQVLSGSWPKGAPEDGYGKLIKLANKYQIPSFLDCTGKQLDAALLEHPFCVHLNRRELTEYTGLEDFSAAQQTLKKYCEITAITDGAYGLYFDDNTNTFQSVFKIDKPYSTIGSGDCLLAGMVAGYVQKKSSEHIANLGAACGAANCLRQDLGMLYRFDVENILGKKLAN